MVSTDIFSAEKITGRLTRIRMPGAVFAYLVTGSERAAVIDTGCGLGPFRRYVEEQLGGKPYELILTHGHVDHAGGASEFDRVWLNERDWKIAAEHTEKGMRANYLKRSFPELTEEDMPEAKKDGYLPLAYGQTFDLGDETLEIVCLGGHTPGSVGILFREDRILLAGDACCSFTLMFGGDASLKVPEYRDNLQAAWDRYSSSFDRMIYSHPHNYGGPEVLTQMIELCGDILAGKDDRVERPGRGGTVSYVAKAVDEKNCRLDGKIANLLYTSDSL